MTDKHPKRPRDLNQLAKMMVDLASGETSAPSTVVVEGKMATAGRIGGLKGGKARADLLTHERRREIAQAAAAKRWSLKI